MTIVEKWRLMLSAFADIKAAIIENDGVEINGYEAYAKGVRSIYSTDEYIPQYTYPNGSDVLDRAEFCINVKEEIRQAIIDGGVECDENVPLSEYGNKIREISDPIQILTQSDTVIGYMGEPCNYQLEATGGTPPYTWSTDAWWLFGTRLNSDGTITGTPTRSMSGNCSVTVTDAKGKSTTITLWLRIAKEA